jgi:cytidyltransferase-like protein
MEFFQRAHGQPSQLGILPGAFNPVTVAHLALARAALGMVDEIVLVLPRVLPHKEYSGASFEERLEILRAAAAGHTRFSIAASQGGLFQEIARECRQAYGPEPRLWFLCGRDAAERIAGWDYGAPDAFPRMLREFGLLVAARGGEYLPAGRCAGAILRLELGDAYEHVSATEVRRRILHREPWKHLVPETARALAQTVYAR